jgi:hypothetical protein
MRGFYTDFATCYGTIWLALTAVALVSQTHINPGIFGVVGFPLISLIYAASRSGSRRKVERRIASLEHRIVSLMRQLGREGRDDGEPLLEPIEE